ncbi:tRNA (adenosine(37)-N6)-threonylcarbamoyltransferase complex dimerization subunit type 1 TsaB [Pauljensenia sp. UMB0895]|uniref:tRNA (adenosine(37)-N6)-threonylcarbamoyltransferase complex dimerization subunit type 1 TsaB n=1 Tax=Pauljensenia sp. UMB0895 TaxID=3046319 RepID=UPI00255070C6|nr:tRNA (adenosine(37)-N6)-threonylcarbamoyltransferase complex dimerization subunit type 1 TsaB [Pauljensenia sp. UMB0895]MDK7337514.1 tRNA (adenosine(37)-N6)-threonylcarbamoyltransferase complex dimerization subunit type 1 TsaB [Pauljensenia sp. UMB0895]MDK8299583.1 tRNA (adenosine(37)-N6)-threonylcarbamoyltransferase complex dimerization subunit type 1 TsaB [Actinomycetaceae bacterium UMB1218B]
MIELSLDTSAATIVSVLKDGTVVGHAHNESTRHHAESITELVRETLGQAGLPVEAKDAGIERVLVGTGPAPFTGLRAGLVSARVFALAAGVPVYGASSLDVIARQALDLLPPDTHVYAVSDARRKELYWGHYVAEGADDVRLIGRLEVGTAQSLLNSMRDADGLIISAGELPAHSVDCLAPAGKGPIVDGDPAVLSRIVSARLAKGEEDRLGTEPLYLRRPEIHGQPMERM